MLPNGLSRSLATLVEGVLRHRTLTLGILAVALLLAVLGLTRLRIDFSSTSFYGGDSEAATRLAEFQQRWGADDRTLLVLTHPRDPDDGDMLTPERLAALSAMRDSLAADAQVESVTCIADLRVPVPALTGEPTPRGLAELVAQLHVSELAPAQRRALIEQLPFVPSLLSADGLDTVIVVELRVSSDDVMRTHAVVDGLERELAVHDQTLAQLGLSYELAGVPAIRAAFFDLLTHDQMLFVPLTMSLIAVCLWWVFRRVHAVLIPALAAALPTAMLLGIMGWAGEPLGLLNQAYFTLLPVIAVADAIHMVARWHEERRNDPSCARDVVLVRACSKVGLACLLTSLTTAAGFGSLLLADMPILRGFGLYAALGVVLAFVLSVVLVPLLLSFVRDEQVPMHAPGLRAIDAVVGASLRRPKLVVAIGVVLLVASLFAAARVRVDNTLTGLLEPEHPVSVASRRVDTKLGGVLGLELEITAPTRTQLLEPEHLAELLELERWLSAQAEVRSVEGLASALADVGPLRMATPTIPNDTDEIAARLELLRRYAPLGRMLDDDGPWLRVHVGMPDAGARQFVAFAERAQAELDARVSAPLHGRATGTALLAYRGVNGITEDLRSSFALVFVVVVGVIALSFRSLSPALAAILPNLGPLLLGYAALGLLGRVLDPLAAVILTLALGIAVDDTLHVMVRTREQLRDGNDIDTAVREAIRHSGWAVAVTSIVIAGALALNLASSFPPLSLLGLLGSVVIALALLGNISLLPASLALLRGRGLQR